MTNAKNKQAKQQFITIEHCRWGMSPATVNAYYGAESNQISKYTSLWHTFKSAQ